MTSAPLEIEGVVRASELGAAQVSEEHAGEWTRRELAGRLCEVSGTGASAALTWVIRLVRDSQMDGEPVAWVSSSREVAFYPPDVRCHGVDLGALPVVRMESAARAGRAADRLVRSGGFGVVIVDLVAAGGGGGRSGREAGGELARPLQKRLVKHAEQQDVAVVCVTDKAAEHPSIGAMVSFRGAARRRREGGGAFRCRMEALADRQGGPGWSREAVLDGPIGLR